MRDAKTLKELLGSDARDIIANGYGMEEISGKYVCPVHDDHEPSMSWFNEGNNFNCFACNAKIDIFDYYTDKEGLSFNEALKKVSDMVGEERVPMKKEKKVYVKPNINTLELSKDTIEYFAERGISEETLNDWKIVERIGSSTKAIVFQYFVDGELTFVSYREPWIGGRKGGTEKNTKQVLYGMDMVDKKEPLVITEGQIDALSIYEAGYKNVVSVPMGSNNLNWIDNCWEWLKGVEEIIVWADNDEPGLQMAENIERRLNNVKIMTAQYKDANDMLLEAGGGEVVKAIKAKINEMPEGVIDLSTERYITKAERYKNTIATGIYEYDSKVMELKPSEITVLFGRNGEGKTTIISQMVANFIENGHKTFLFNGESSRMKVIEDITAQVVGNDRKYYIKGDNKYGIYFDFKPNVISAVQDWLSGKLFLFDLSKDYSQNKLFEYMEVAYRRFGIEVFVIDNLMTALLEKAESINTDQANFVQACKNFAVEHNVHVILVTHPNKGKSEVEAGEDLRPNLEKTDISGSNNIANKADNIISIERVFYANDDEESAIFTSHKDRYKGMRFYFTMKFSSDSRRFYTDRTPEHVTYGWEKYLKGSLEAPVYDTRF